MTTIVQFPANRIVREIAPNVEEIERAKEKGLQKHAETIVEDMFLSMMDALENYGIDVETEQFERDFTFAADALRATVYRTFGIDHGLHEFINTNVQIVKAENYDDLREKMKAMLQETEETVDKTE
jgi:formiminotetrahydrofolate cyclodeaminase